ncbi:hypothetical protein ScPMuIL_016424, partial [Solemya velum]
MTYQTHTDRYALMNKVGDESKNEPTTCQTPTLKERLVHLADTTSLHGIPRVVSYTRWYRKLIWLLLVLTVVCYLIVQLNELYQVFMRSPIKTSVSMEYQPAMSFPAVTLCNVNPIRKSKNEEYRTALLNNTDESYLNVLVPVTVSSVCVSVSPTQADHTHTHTQFCLSDCLSRIPEHSESNYYLITQNAKLNGNKRGFEVFSVRTFEFQATIRSICTQRNDIWGSRVLARLEYAHNLPAVGAIYHQQRAQWLLPMPVWTKGVMECDTTSRIFGIGKGISLKKAMSSEFIEGTCKISRPFEPRAGGESVGEHSETLNQLRFRLSTEKAVNSLSTIQTHTLPPTSASAKFHSLRVYLQVHDWTKESEMDPTLWGWKLENGQYFPKVTFNDTMDYYYYYDDEEEKSEEKQMKEKPFDEWHRRQLQLLFYMSTMSWTQRESVGHQYENRIVECTVAGKECLKEYTIMFTSTYGTCFTLESPAYKTKASGPLYGISITLNLENFEFIDDFRRGYGARLVIHQPGTMPMPDQEGITLSAGYETTVSLKKVSIHKRRLGSPYGVCEEGEGFQTFYNMQYTRQVALFISFANYLLFYKNT